MPAISMFYGIIIYMYWDDHMPPHFHARYQGQNAMFNLEGDTIGGTMPHKQCKLIAAWAQLHHEELEANWELLQNKEEPFRIDSLH